MDHKLNDKDKEIRQLKAEIDALKFAYEDLKNTIVDEQPTVNSLRIGQTLFVVIAIGEHSYYTRRTVASLPYLDHYTKSPFIKVTYRSNFSPYSIIFSKESLKDINIIPNGYNNHKAFYNEVDAYTYLRKCIAENIGDSRNKYGYIIPSC